jgi:hypothetical protein
MGHDDITFELPRRMLFPGLVFVVLGLLYFTSTYSYLLFHSIAEIFSVVVAFGIFMLAWNSRRFLDNNSLLFIGIAYFFVGMIDILHTLAYKGMGVFSGYDANLPTQLWIAARYLQSISLLLAPFSSSARCGLPVLAAYAAPLRCRPSLPAGLSQLYQGSGDALSGQAIRDLRDPCNLLRVPSCKQDAFDHPC